MKQNQITHASHPFSTAELVDSIREIMDDLQIGEIDEYTAAPILRSMFNQVKPHYDSLSHSEQYTVAELEDYLQ